MHVSSMESMVAWTLARAAVSATMVDSCVSMVDFSSDLFMSMVDLTSASSASCVLILDRAQKSKVLVGGGAQSVRGSPLSHAQAVSQELEGASKQSKHDAPRNMFLRLRE